MRGLVPVQSLSQVWALSQKFCICSLLALLIAFCYSPCSRKNKQLCLPQSLPSSQHRRGSPPGDPLRPRGVPSSAVALPSQLSSLNATLLFLTVSDKSPHSPSPSPSSVMIFQGPRSGASHWMLVASDSHMFASARIIWRSTWDTFSITGWGNLSSKEEGCRCDLGIWLISP